MFYTLKTTTRTQRGNAYAMYAFETDIQAFMALDAHLADHRQFGRKFEMSIRFHEEVSSEPVEIYEIAYNTPIEAVAENVDVRAKYAKLRAMYGNVEIKAIASKNEHARISCEDAVIEALGKLWYVTKTYPVTNWMIYRQPLNTQVYSGDNWQL